MNSNVKNEIPSGSTSRKSGGFQLDPRSQFVPPARDDSPKSKYLKMASTARSTPIKAARTPLRLWVARPRMSPKT